VFYHLNLYKKQFISVEEDVHMVSSCLINWRHLHIHIMCRELLLFIKCISENIICIIFPSNLNKVSIWSVNIRSIYFL